MSSTDPTAGAGLPFGAVVPGGQYADAIHIVGYPGESSFDDKKRLYLDPGLKAFAEYDPNDEVAVHPVPDSPVGGGVIVYLQPQAQVTHVQTQSQTIESFMQGALVQSAARKAQAATQIQGAAGDDILPAGFLSIFGCPSPGGGATNYDSIFWCRSRFMCNPHSIECLC